MFRKDTHRETENIVDHFARLHIVKFVTRTRKKFLKLKSALGRTKAEGCDECVDAAEIRGAPKFGVVFSDKTVESF